MKFKGFNFPTFEEWEKNRYHATDFISTFTADICISQKNASFTIPDEFSAYVSFRTSGYYDILFKYISLPTFYYNPVKDSKENLKNWYNSVIKELNEKFEEYLITTFFEISSDNEIDKTIIKLSSSVEEADEYINKKGFDSFDKKIEYLKDLFNIDILSKKDSDSINEEKSKEMDYFSLLNIIILDKEI